MALVVRFPAAPLLFSPSSSSSAAAPHCYRHRRRHRKLLISKAVVRAEARREGGAAASGAAVVWFKNDLRVDDHPGLVAAAARHRTVVPLYVFDPRLLSGWEGSAADMRVLRWVCEQGGFTVPEGKYYLVDSGYANTDKFLAPYRGERYHLSQFDSSTRARTHRNPKDLYNHRHAQLRNVVEKTFGILKKRFKILTHATPFSYKVQCMIAMACCVVHNFIRRHQGNDMYFNEEMDQVPTSDDDEDPTNIASTDESRRGETLRSAITEQLWNNRC